MRAALPPLRWWAINPANGLPFDSSPSPNGEPTCYLGDEVLDDAGSTADYIDATFGARRYFSDNEARLLIFQRELPAAVCPYPDASAELLECVDGLWTSVGQAYRAKWGREPTAVERRLIGEFTVWVLRPDSPDHPCPVVRPVA